MLGSFLTKFVSFQPALCYWIIRRSTNGRRIGFDVTNKFLHYLNYIYPDNVGVAYKLRHKNVSLYSGLKLISAKVHQSAILVENAIKRTPRDPSPSRYKLPSNMVTPTASVV
jgi:hypothetical protein